jgi:hypothetical protein
MKTIYRKTVSLSLLLVVMFMIVGIAAADDRLTSQLDKPSQEEVGLQQLLLGALVSDVSAPGALVSDVSAPGALVSAPEVLVSDVSDVSAAGSLPGDTSAAGSSAPDTTRAALETAQEAAPEVAPA